MEQQQSLAEIPGIEPRPVRQQIYDVLRDAILSGRLRIGQSLPERELAASLGVSRTPLREALIKLEQEGLVEIRPYKDVVVSGISRQQFFDIMELRAVLEAHAARLAAEKMPPPEIERLQALFAQLHPHIESGDIASCIALNDEFHATVARWSGNAELERLITNYEDRENLFIRTFGREPRFADMLQSYREHCKIMAALVTRDAPLASELMLAHMRDSTSRAAHLFPDQAQPGDGLPGS
jgi:DNA-binding GntR family transcriptional regulator